MFFIYIVTNRWKAVLYTGVTSNLSLRVSQHQARVWEGFSKKYNADLLVYFEEFTDVRNAIAREKQIKGWRRSKKEHLINQTNPLWVDLSRPFG